VHAAAGYKLQLVLRKVALLPVAIPPTGPAVANSKDIRVGIAQENTEVSNVSDLPLIDPSDPNFGKFLADDPNAAMLSLAAGEYAYATIRAIGLGAPDPADLLQWGVKTVASNATSGNGPLVIRTLSFSAAFVASPPAPVNAPLTMFGGKPAITGNAVCTDKLGNTVLNATGVPGAGVGVDGNYYIDTAAQLLYGPKTGGAWGGGTSLIKPIDQDHPTPYASVPCPPAGIALGPFTSVTAPDLSVSTTAPVTFTPKYWGDFYTLASVADASSPAQTDRQVIKVHVDPRPPALAANFPTPLTYNNGGLAVNLRALVSSDSTNGAGVAQPIVITAIGQPSCHMADADKLVIDHATVPPGGPADCIVTVHQDGNEIFAPATVQRAILINQADQGIVVDSTPTTLTYNNFHNVAATLTAHATSTTAPNSGLPVTFSSTTTPVCTTSGTNGADIKIESAGTCNIVANQSGNNDYKAAPTLSPPLTITVNKADQTLAFGAAPSGVTFGNGAQTVGATSSSQTAPPSGIGIVFNSQTTAQCTVAGTSVAILGAGTCTIGATQGGNGNYNPTTAAPPQSFAIAKADQAITFGAAPSGVTFGDPPVTVSATSATVQPPSGTAAPASGIAVVLTSQTPAVCTIAGTSVTIVAAGTCTIAANQAGNGNYNAAPEKTQSFQVARGKVLVTATVSPTSFVYGDDVAPNAVVLTTGSTHTEPAACLLAPYAATVSGVPTAPGNAGTYTLVPSVTSSIHSSCDVVPTNATLTIDRAPTQIVVDSLYFTLFGDTTSFDGKVNRTDKTSVFPSIAPTIAVQPNGGTLTGSAPVAPDGVFTVTSSPSTLASNTYSLTFSYAGDTNFLAATSVNSKLRIEGFSSAGTMTQPRARHRSVLLDDGRVLIAGGFYTSAGAYARTATAEVYCPDTMSPAPTLAQCPNGVGAFSAVGSLHSGSDGHTLTKLLDGRVLKVGGKNVDLEIFDPATNAWTLLTAALPVARAFHQATLLTCSGPCSYNGKVLITGGDDGTSNNNASGNTTATTLIFDPATNTLSAGPNMSTARDSHSATALDDGRVLIAGGEQLSAPSTYIALNSAEIFDPTLPACSPSTLGCMAPVPSMADARFSDGAVLLGNGKVLIAGGSNDPSGQRTGLLASVEIFDPATNTWASLPSYQLNESRRAHSLTLLYDGWALAVGRIRSDHACRHPTARQLGALRPGGDAIRPR
jgi:hypothetical protein